MSVSNDGKKQWDFVRNIAFVVMAAAGVITWGMNIAGGSSSAAVSSHNKDYGAHENIRNEMLQLRQDFQNYVIKNDQRWTQHLDEVDEARIQIIEAIKMNREILEAIKRNRP